MMRWAPIIAILLVCGAAIGAAVWVHAALASSFARGEALGRALVEAQVAAALDERNGELAAIRRDADRDAAALEAERDQLRDRVDDLEKTIAAPLVGGGARRDVPCLDAGLVRALDAIRRQPVGAGGP